jgi:hypothetical protein
MGLAASLFRTFFVRGKESREDYPDLDQSKTSSDEKCQKTDCAPVADANIIRHLHLADNDSDEKLVEELRRDMGTRALGDDNPGTEPDEVIKGTEKYLKDHRKKMSKSWWCGWGAGQTKRKGFDKAPKFNWIARSLMKKDQEVVLQIGMYKKTADGNYERVSGHFVTCTGFEKKGMKLKLNDPAPRASREEETLETQELKSGKLITKDGDQVARGYTEIKGLDLVEGADIAIIDGAFAYKVR